MPSVHLIRSILAFGLALGQSGSLVRAQTCPRCPTGWDEYSSTVTIVNCRQFIGLYTVKDPNGGCTGKWSISKGSVHIPLTFADAVTYANGNTAQDPCCQALGAGVKKYVYASYNLMTGARTSCAQFCGCSKNCRPCETVTPSSSEADAFMVSSLTEDNGPVCSCSSTQYIQEQEFGLDLPKCVDCPKGLVANSDSSGCVCPNGGTNDGDPNAQCHCDPSQGLYGTLGSCQQCTNGVVDPTGSTCTCNPGYGMQGGVCTACSGAAK